MCHVALKGTTVAQQAAMKALTALASPQAVERLARVPGFEWTDELNTRIRMLAACGPPAAPELVRALSVDDSATWIALMALRRMGVDAVPALCDGLVSRFSRTVTSSARLLGEIGNALAVEPLSRAMLRTEPEVRREAVLALGKLGCDGARETLRQAVAAPDLGPLAALALVELGHGSDELVPPLVRVLQDHDSRVRVRAARALERLAEAEAPLSLRSALGPLRRLSWSWLIDGDERALCRHVAERIRAATVGISDLPIPRRAGDTDSLPVPAEPAETREESLPRPSREYERGSQGA
ncbi:MAG: HEAT repeat domain-containing protein [Armatimonadota bacterium]